MTLSRRAFFTAFGSMTLLPLLGQTSNEHSATPEKYAVIGTVITGDKSPPRQVHAVLVENGIIKTVAPATDIAAHDLPVYSGAYIIPGVINCHAHRIHSAKERRERYLLHGVTAIGDVASPLAAMDALLTSPKGNTATASCSGPILCPPGGYPLPIHSPKHGLVVTSPHHGRERVRQLADLGASMVKLAFEPGPYASPWPLFDATTAEAICNEARKLGMTIRCHVEDFGGLQKALNAGVHTVEHVPYRWIDSGAMHNVLEKDGTRHVPIAPYRALLEQMVREEIILTPTLDVLSRSMWDGPELYEPVRCFAALGGRIAVGNDHPYRRTEAGMPLNEMQLLKKAGLDTRTILAGATSISAAACGLRTRGTIDSGKAADMLVLTNNPLENTGALSSPLHVIKDGVFVS